MGSGSIQVCFLFEEMGEEYCEETVGLIFLQKSKPQNNLIIGNVVGNEFLFTFDVDGI